jgi:thiamine kinase-like enzyme
VRPHQRAETAELTPLLEDILSTHFARTCSIARLSRADSAYRTSAVIEELEVTLDDGATIQLVFKDVGDAALSEAARRAKPAFLRDPLREIEVYRTILGSRDLSTAECYGAAVDPERGRFWLFLEKVPGLELYQVGELATWQEVARWLARAHASFAPGAERLARRARLVRYDPAFFRTWIDRACAHATGSARESLQWLAARYEPVVERLAALPVTVLHGELYASNVLVAKGADGTRVCPVDWEMAALGPHAVDLAALVARWDAGPREQLARAYHDALAADDGGVAPWPQFAEQLALCRLHLAVQWLGWAPDWAPPPEHAHDWLAEALELAEELGL